MEHEIEPSEGENSLLPFQDLVAPEPIDAAPPTSARLLAFGAILLGGLLGAVVGYGVGDLMGQSSNWAAIGAFVGGLTGAVGCGVVANLTLRAMNEWRAVEHPEAEADDKGRAGEGSALESETNEPEHPSETGEQGDTGGRGDSGAGR
ncbi:MAG: hypothetical protein ACR2QK_10795 [Acidimicrobiales bacterium]